MKILMICVALLLVVIGNPSFALDRKALGWGLMFTNDLIGDNKDRWRTGSFAVSHLRGPSWTGTRPTRFGDLIELRFRGEVISPERISAPSPQDRRYVGALSLGAHTHWQSGQTELSLGLDLVMVGPQTGLDSFQAQLHDIFGGPRPNVDGFQIANDIYPTLMFEAGRQFDLSASARLRPFVEVQAGAETLIRAGADFTMGPYGGGDLMLRDVSSGQRYQGITSGDGRGLSFVIGGDLAYIADSRYLDTPGVIAEDYRARLRIGYHRGWKRAGLFYGLSYLSPEFEAQSAGQFLGGVSLRYRF